MTLRRRIGRHRDDMRAIPLSLLSTPVLSFSLRQRYRALFLFAREFHIPFRRGHSIAITKRCRKPAVVILTVYCASRFSCSRGNHYLWQGALRTVYYPVAPNDERPNSFVRSLARRWRWLVPMRPAAKDYLPPRLITRNHAPSFSPKRDETRGIDSPWRNVRAATTT